MTRHQVILIISSKNLLQLTACQGTDKGPEESYKTDKDALLLYYTNLVLFYVIAEEILTVNMFIYDSSIYPFNSKRIGLLTRGYRH